MKGGESEVIDKILNIHAMSLNRGNVSFDIFWAIAYNLIFYSIYFSLVIPVHKVGRTALPVIVNNRFHHVKLTVGITRECGYTGETHD